MAPSSVRWTASLSASGLTRPKSSSLATSKRPPRWAAKTLPGLMSRWIRPTACASRSACAHLPQEVYDALGGQRAVALEQRLQAQAGQVLHHVIEGAVVGPAIIEDLDGVPVRQAGRRTDLAFEAGENLPIAGTLGMNQLDGTGPLQHAVLGEIDLAHAAGAEQFDEAVLADLPGFVDFAAQGIDQVGADDGRRRGDEQHQHVLRDAHGGRHRGDLRIGERHAGEQEQRGERHGAGDAGRAAPGVGDEHAIGADQQDPERHGWRRDAAAGIVTSPAVLEHEEEHGRQAEDNQLGDAQLRDGHGALPAQGRGTEAQDQDDDHVRDQQHGRDRLAREQAHDVADQENAEADQQDERGGAQAQAQQRLRFLCEVRPAAGERLAARAADLRALVGVRPRLEDRLLVHGRGQGGYASAVHGLAPLRRAAFPWINHTQPSRRRCGSTGLSNGQGENGHEVAKLDRHTHTAAGSIMGNTGTHQRGGQDSVGSAPPEQPPTEFSP